MRMRPSPFWLAGKLGLVPAIREPPPSSGQEPAVRRVGARTASAHPAHPLRGHSCTERARALLWAWYLPPASCPSLGVWDPWVGLGSGNGVCLN